MTTTAAAPLCATYMYDAVRTPFGRYGGSLAGVRPDDLAAVVVRALVERTGLGAGDVDEVVLGDANGAGEDNRNVARMAALLAGLSVDTPATTVNRLCGSGLDAVIMASRAIDVGDADVVVAGGVESMSRAPWVFAKPESPYPRNDAMMISSTLGWRFVNPRMPDEWTVSLGAANEMLQQKYDIARIRQDEFALSSHQRAHEAWEAGFYDELVVNVPGIDLVRDEGIRPALSLEQLAMLKPAFGDDGTITAGNASPLSDGASAVLLGALSAATKIGHNPIARIASRAAAAAEPPMFGIAPIEAANEAIRKAGISWREVGVVELNEAFAVQSLACLDGWDVDPAIVNTRGGALAIGHPLGASGGRILATLAAAMKKDGHHWGVAAICIGVGQALAVVLENAEECS